MRPFITPNGAILINRLSDNKGLQTAQHLAIGHIGGIIVERGQWVRGPPGPPARSRRQQLET